MKLLGPMRADVQKHAERAVGFLLAALERGGMRTHSRRNIEWVIAQLRAEGPAWDYDGYRETLRDVQSDDLLPQSVSANIDRACDALYDALRAWDEYACEEAAQCAAYRMGEFA